MIFHPLPTAAILFWNLFWNLQFLNMRSVPPRINSTARNWFLTRNRLCGIDAWALYRWEPERRQGFSRLLTWHAMRNVTFGYYKCSKPAVVVGSTVVRSPWQSSRYGMPLAAFNTGQIRPADPFLQPSRAQRQTVKFTQPFASVMSTQTTPLSSILWLLTRADKTLGCGSPGLCFSGGGWGGFEAKKTGRLPRTIFSWAPPPPPSSPPPHSHTFISLRTIFKLHNSLPITVWRNFFPSEILSRSPSVL